MPTDLALIAAPAVLPMKETAARVYTAGYTIQILCISFAVVVSWKHPFQVVNPKPPVMKLRLQNHLFSFPLFAAMFLLLCATVSTGCGGNAGQKAEVKAVQAPPSKPLQQASGYIPAMYLERDEFLGGGSLKYKDKLLIRLSAQPDSNRYLLSVLEAGKTGKGLVNAKPKYPKAFANELLASDVAKNNTAEEHHTKENDYQQLWDEVKKYTLVKYVIFEPEVDSNKHFCYKITGVEKLPLDLNAHGFATKTYYSHPSNHSWK